jgi:hypothetical protein
MPGAYGSASGGPVNRKKILPLMKEEANGSPNPFIDRADLRVLRSLGDGYRIPAKREGVKGIGPKSKVGLRERHTFATSDGPEYFP